MTKLNNWNLFVLCGLLVALNTSQSLISVFETLIIGTALYISIKSRINPFKSIPKAINYSLVLLFISISLSYVFGVSEFKDTKIKGFLEIRWIIFFLSSIVIISQTIWKKQNLKHLLYCFAFATLANFACYILVEQERAGGLFRNPMFYAQNLGPLLLVLLSVVFFLISEHKSSPNKKIIIMTLLTLSLGLTLLLLTQTRGVWLGFIAAIFANVYFLRNKLIVVATAVLLILCTLVFILSPTMQDRVTMKSEASSYSKAVRPIIWKGHLELFKQSPITGVGYNINNLLYFERLTDEEKSIVEKEEGLHKIHAHNQYIQFLAGTGVLGFLSYLSFLFIILTFTIKSLKTQDKTSFNFFLSSGLLAGLICFLVSGITECNFSISKNRSLFLVLAATSIALTLKKDEKVKIS